MHSNIDTYTYNYVTRQVNAPLPLTFTNSPARLTGPHPAQGEGEMDGVPGMEGVALELRVRLDVPLTLPVEVGVMLLVIVLLPV